MAHSYRIKHDRRDEVLYRKKHDNGDETDVFLQKSQNGDWTVTVLDNPGGRMRLGQRGTKQKAKELARNWMSKNPKGLQGPSGAMGTLNAMDRSVESIFTGGGRF